MEDPPGAGSCDRACSTPRRAHQGDETHLHWKKGPGGCTSALGARARQGAPRVGDEGVGGRATAAGSVASCRRQEAGAEPGTEAGGGAPGTEKKEVGGPAAGGRPERGWPSVGIP